MAVVKVSKAADWIPPVVRVQNKTFKVKVK